MLVVCQSWIQQCINNVAQPDPQVYVMTGVANHPKTDGGFGIQASYHTLPQIVQPVFFALTCGACLAALPSSNWAVVDTYPESAWVLLHADCLDCQNRLFLGPRLPEPRPEQIGFPHVFHFCCLREGRAQQCFRDLLVLKLLVSLLPLGPPLAADAKAIPKFKSVQGNKGFAASPNFVVCLQYLLSANHSLVFGRFFV